MKRLLNGQKFLTQLLLRRQNYFGNSFRRGVALGIKYEWKSLDDVETTTQGLQEAAANLAQVALAMRENAMNQALFPWTQRQWDCFDIITTMTAQCVAVLPAQIKAKQQNRPSQYEAIKEKSARDVAQRKARQSESAAAPAPAAAKKKPVKKRGK